MVQKTVQTPFYPRFSLFTSLPFIPAPHLRHLECFANASAKLTACTWTDREPDILQANDEHINEKVSIVPM